MHLHLAAANPKFGHNLQPLSVLKACLAQGHTDM